VVNGCTHCTPENTHWTPGIIASNGCAGATPAHPAHTSGAHASGAYPGRDAPAPQGLPRAQGGLQPAPSPVSGIRTPKRPLLPAWEKGVGRMRGQTRTRGRDARAPGAHLRCARLRRIPRQRRSSPAGASTRSGRVQPAPSPVSGIRTPKRPLLPAWEKGVGRMRGQTCTRGRDARAPGAHLRCARLRRIPRQRRSSPAGASTRSGRASARTLSCFRHQDAQTPPSPRVGEGGRGDEGTNVHTRAQRPRT